MGTKYSSQNTSGYNSSPPADDGTQVASNLVTWAGVKTKLADVLKTFGEAINTALVSALDLSARAISSNDTAIASDHWKTLQVTGTTTISLSSAASMGAGYEVGVFNAGVAVVTVTPAGADTINGFSVSVIVPIKGTMVFRTNSGLNGYNIVAQSNSSLSTSSGGVYHVFNAPTNGGFATFQVGGTAFADIGSRLAMLGGGNADNLLILGRVGKPLLFGVGAGVDLAIDASHNVVPTNLLDLTTATAGQIGFPAAQNPSAGANVLDDYEEGTWVPSMGGTTTHNTQAGFYTKIGDTINFWGRIVINVNGTGATITGLPFTSNSGTDYRAIVNVQILNATTATTAESGTITSNATAIIPQIKTAAATTWTNLAAANLANGATLHFSGSYKI